MKEIDECKKKIADVLLQCYQKTGVVPSGVDIESINVCEFGSHEKYFISSASFKGVHEGELSDQIFLIIALLTELRESTGLCVTDIDVRSYISSGEPTVYHITMRFIA